jgi:hypothetical protein
MMTPEPKHKPPKRQPGWGQRARRLSGEALDVASTSLLLGQSELQTRSQISRAILPYRRLGGRIICLRSEILSYLNNELPGVTLEQARANLAKRRGE